MGIYKDKRELTKNIIIDSFWTIYERKPLSKISIKEITDKAGYNRSTFYIHFKNVEDVLQCVETMVLDDYKSCFHLISTHENTREISTKIYIEFMKKNSRFFPKLLMASQECNFNRKYKEILKEVIKYLVITQEYKESLNNDFLLEYITTGLIGCMYHWCTTNHCSIDELCKTLDALIIHSLKCPLIDYNGNLIT